MPSVLSPGCRRRTRSAYVHCRSGLNTPSYFHRRSRNARVSASARVLPRHDLRPGPVDVEDLRLPGLERGEVLVEAPFLDFPFFVPVRLEILADFREPVAGNSRPGTRRESPRSRCSGSTDEPPLRPCRPECLGNRAQAPPGDPAATSLRMLSAGSTDVVLHVCVGAFQPLAIRRERALERDDLVTYIHFYGRHRFVLPFPKSRH